MILKLLSLVQQVGKSGTLEAGISCVCIIEEKVTTVSLDAELLFEKFTDALRQIGITLVDYMSNTFVHKESLVVDDPWRTYQYCQWRSPWPRMHCHWSPQNKRGLPW